VSRLAEAAPAPPAETAPRRFGPAAVAVATVIVLALAPVVVGAFFLTASYAHGSLAYDFRHAYLHAAEVLVDGRSPYPELDDPRLAAETAYVYPPLLGWVLTPATLLANNVAYVAAALVSLALVLGSLLVLGVRDWRCYGAVLLWAPTLIGIQTASASLLVVLLVALAWRYREHTFSFAASLGLGIAVKLFVWPLLVWTLALRRIGAAIASVVAAAAAILVPWAFLGFEDLRRYPSILERLAELEAEKSYSFVGVTDGFGLGTATGQVLAVATGVALLAVCVVLGRRGDDLGSFTAAVAAALAFTPVIWQHYLVLLLVPLAVARPRFSALWLLPVALWLAERDNNGVPIQTVLPLLVTVALVTALLVRPAAREPEPSVAPAAARP
jgi:alpha-1,2-mannosyltransferase